MESITNKVADSGIITIDPADFYVKGDRILIDIKPLLVEELLLREKDFREYIKTANWQLYQDKLVAITCTNDAIIPVWAYMLLTTALEPFAKKIVFGSISDLEAELFKAQIQKLDPVEYKGQRVVIKGCGDIHVPPFVYVELTRLLKPFVKSIMYGEPCSTVPIYKNQG